MKLTNEEKYSEINPYKPRFLKSTWTLEAQEDIKLLHGIDLQMEMVKALQYELNRERKIQSSK